MWLWHPTFGATFTIDMMYTPRCKHILEFTLCKHRIHQSPLFQSKLARAAPPITGHFFSFMSAIMFNSTESTPSVVKAIEQSTSSTVVTSTLDQERFMMAPDAPATASTSAAPALTSEQQATFDLITRNLQEVLGADAIKARIASGDVLKCYWGW
jgi:hypothetical protein